VDELSVDTKAAWRDAAERVSMIEGGQSKRTATVLSVSVPAVKDALAAYYVVASAEASSNLSRYDGVRYGYRSDDADSRNDVVDDDDTSVKSTRRPAGDLHAQYMKTRSVGFGPEVKRRLLTGSFVLSRFVRSFVCYVALGLI
jgi:aspartyl-tRNA(Asn)/glutamyl-tRNA(Gln) amidotransferase subunit A